ncbi:MAG: BREX-1 system adenine-specific DNA-methyltransferase PglX [Candidatus Izemoplasmataceae bacterium]
MDKKALQTFAVWAKNNLETQIKVSLKLLGINSDKDIKKAHIQGDITVIEGDSKTYSRDLKLKRDNILELIKNDGYDYTVEQFAYTWFNRFIALRFMEVHDYLPHGFKVFPKNNGSIEPEILSKLSFVKDELNLDIELCLKYKESSSIEELYRYVLFKQCNALSEILPMLFSNEYSYLELLLPSTLLKGQTIITELVKINESNFLDDVEVIGWLYQFYVSSDREEFRKAKVVSKDLIPTLTQIFTPDWIVRYMTENSLGRLWLESYPDSEMKREFKYYVDDAKQTEEVSKKLEEIRYKNVKPEDITMIEPCSGSGHILVYAFDILMLMYEEKGYSKNDIPILILENNLYGLDIDKRASQLASFSLMMKARSIDSRFFNTNRIVFPKVHEIRDSKMLISLDYKRWINELNNSDWKNDEKLSEKELEIIDYIVDTYRDGKTIGSLLKVDRHEYLPLVKKIRHLHQITIRGFFNVEFVEYGLKRIYQLLELAEVMSKKYDVMVTNPPYLGISRFQKSTKEFFYRCYPLSKTDMFSMFMETNFVKNNGFCSIVNPDSWMFLSTFEKFRNQLLDRLTLINIIHLGMGSFDSVVQTTSHVFRNLAHLDFEAAFINLTSSSNKEQEFFNKSNYKEMSLSSFKVVPGKPFAYWASQKALKCFSTGIPLGKISKARRGLETGNNEKFLRFWFEVNYNDIDFSCLDIQLFKKKWLPHNKGGNFRNWYGNYEYVVLFENNAEKIRISGALNGSDAYLHEGITWTAFTSYKNSFRLAPRGMTFDSNKGPLIENTKDNLLTYLLAFLNSSVAHTFLKVVNPTVSLQNGDLDKIPIILSENYKSEVTSLCEKCIELSKWDWNSTEYSYGFTKHPLVNGKSIKHAYQNWESKTKSRFMQLKKYHERINTIFISMYGLNKEISSELQRSEIVKTVHLANKKDDIKTLISYLVGVALGRYSLKKDGIVYAGVITNGNINLQYDSSKDGIIPIVSDLGIKTGLDTIVLNLIKIVYGENTYKENVDFVAEGLGKKQNETSEETINRYIYNDFYYDHLKIYRKRPIYWMFSSGKNNAFKCLLYMHRYDEDTLANINSEYFQPESTRIKHAIEDIENQILTADTKTKISLEKQKMILVEKDAEAMQYGQVLDHMANRYISIDLDDGVKVNYEKFQGIEIVTDSGAKVKKDLLVPIK